MTEDVRIKKKKSGNDFFFYGSHPKKLVNNKGCFDLTLLDLTL